MKSPKKPKIAKEVELSEEEFEAAMAESHEPGLDLDEEVEVLDNDEEFVD